MKPRQLAAWTAAIAALALLLRLVLFNGFGGTDDVTYALRGLEVADGIWRMSDNVTELRFGVSLPIAAASWLLGRSDLALTAWSLLTSLLDLAAVCAIAGWFFGRRVLVLSGLVIAVVPLHVAMGSRALADAPFAAFTTLSFAALIGAMHKPSVALSVLAGAAAGVCWWIKPTAAVLTFVALAGMPLAARRWDPRWLWALPACAGVIGLEWLMLEVKFGNPLLTLGLLLPFLREHIQHTGENVWGESSPWYYFRRFAIDGRELWLLPHLAALGAVAMLLRPAAGAALATRLVLYWAFSLLTVFSFFVISLHPLKFVPKQDNYAVLFVAPLALLAAQVLARWRPIWAGATVALLAAGGFVLAGLQQQQHRGKIDRLEQAIARGVTAPAAYVSGQTLQLARLRARQAGSPLSPSLEPWAALDAAAVSPGGVAGVAGSGRRAPAGALFFAEPASAEFALPAARSLVERVRSCAADAGTITTRAGGAGTLAVGAVAALRSAPLPVIDRQLGFTDGVLHPPAAPVYRLSPVCPPQRP